MKMAINVSAAVLVAAAIGGLWQWRVQADEKAYRLAVANQRMSDLKQDYSQAIAGWEKYRSRMWPKKHEYEALLNEASMLRRLRRDDEAFLLYKLAEKQPGDKGTAVITAIAEISEAKGDYATAIKYYQKAEDIYAKMNVGTSERDFYHARIVMLKQKEQANAAK